jgi:digeranylgeranylglycerophospholipid reductase
MAKKYDLVIVGAGPGGAMAAKTAGENGLRVALLERKTSPGTITRGCAMMFACEGDHYFAERMYYSDTTKKMIFPVNGFSVDYDGPTRNFYAWHFYAPDGKTRLEFGDYDENIKKGDEGRVSLVFDKGRLLDGLIEDAAKDGVDVFTGVNVRGLEKTADGVRVTGSGETFEGTFAIGADGVNSRIAQLVGLNEERTFYTASSALVYYVKGTHIPEPESIKALCYFNRKTSRPYSFFMLPSPYADDEYWMGSRSPTEFEYITKESVYSPWFPGVKVTQVLSYVYSMWSPVSEPYRDNVLLVGDAAWFGEAEITGSMMCGRRAANAVTVALMDNQPNREGVLDYIKWWKKSYPEFDDYRNFMMIMPFRLMFSQEEMVYLFNLIKKPLRPHHNPYLVVRLVKKALEPLMSRIKEEMPSVFEKLEMLEVDKVEKVVLALKGHLDKDNAQKDSREGKR